MDDQRAANESKRAVESGYLLWLITRIHKQAVERFIAAPLDECEKLRDARVLFDMAGVVESIIKDSAKRAQM